ncbi:zinc ribbon domain-containing protein [Legionella tunisiensis]|uniref:zinc ribbon domain-containing protein n=1 Tax=Legionella tunisiensis TaxID=1034944 RepID=UPI0002F3890B|nr:zinc ribbon domain-containing protein [Legionella tunisiensis]
MGLLKRILGNYIGGHQGKTRSGHDNYSQGKHHGGYRNSAPMQTTCPKCNTSVDPQARFCGRCGTSLQESLCACGAFLEAGAQFCAQCGKPRS